MAERRFTTTSAVISGVEAYPVSVEVAIGNGMPGFTIVGMPDAAIQEARERIRSGIKACGYEMPHEKVVVNLAPASLKKTGSGFDLPIALSILAATGQIDRGKFQNTLIIGELSLEGFVRPVHGMMAYRICAEEQKLELICADESFPDDSSFTTPISCINHLGELRSSQLSPPHSFEPYGDRMLLDYRDVGGNEMAKRACQIACAGNHGLLMIGPPGSGKSMLAERIPSILPPAEKTERIEIARIHSIVGEDIRGILQGIRPFRSPHHSASTAGLIGGGNPIQPGEITLAHGGVLFLDELAEFKPTVLQSLRQPIEQGSVTITRAAGSVVMPARFMLVAASNPCPCGYAGDSQIACTCSPAQIGAYFNRIGGPLIDRFDMCIDVSRSTYDEVIGNSSRVSSSSLRDGVLAAREFAFERWKHQTTDTYTSIADLIEAYVIIDEAQLFLRKITSLHSLGGRSISKIISVARTIADLEQRSQVQAEDISLALGLRVRTYRDCSSQ